MMSKCKEAVIDINGLPLSLGESMTLRVAVTSFHAELKRDGLGDDEADQTLCEAYCIACESILRKMGVLR